MPNDVHCINVSASQRLEQASRVAAGSQSLMACVFGPPDSFIYVVTAGRARLRVSSFI